MEEDAESRDMSVFYRQVLDYADSEVVDFKPKDSVIDTKKAEDAEEKRIKEAIESGHVKLNDGGEIVDKSQLLVGGLNIKPVKRMAIEREKEVEAAHKTAAVETNRVNAQQARQIQERYARARDDQARQRKEVDKLAKENEEEEKRRVTELLTEKASESAVDDARARFLARKKQADSDDDSD